MTADSFGFDVLLRVRNRKRDRRYAHPANGLGFNV